MQNVVPKLHWQLHAADGRKARFCTYISKQMPEYTQTEHTERT